MHQWRCYLFIYVAEPAFRGYLCGGTVRSCYGRVCLVLFSSHLLPRIRMYACRVLADILFCVHDVCVFVANGEMFIVRAARIQR